MHAIIDINYITTFLTHRCYVAIVAFVSLSDHALAIAKAIVNERAKEKEIRFSKRREAHKNPSEESERVKGENIYRPIEKDEKVEIRRKRSE